MASTCLSVVIIICSIIALNTATCGQAQFACSLFKERPCIGQFKNYCVWEVRKKKGLNARCYAKSERPPDTPTHFPIDLVDCSIYPIKLECRSTTHKQNNYMARTACAWTIPEDIFHQSVQRTTSGLIGHATRHVEDPMEVFQKLDRNGVLTYVQLNWRYDLHQLPPSGVTKMDSKVKWRQVDLSENRKKKNIKYFEENSKEDSRVVVKRKQWWPKKKPYGRVGIQAILGSGDVYDICSASLIHPRWVLTAAHCIGNKYTHGGQRGIMYPVHTYRFWPGKNEKK
eukprot:439722_1